MSNYKNSDVRLDKTWVIIKSWVKNEEELAMMM